LADYSPEQTAKAFRLVREGKVTRVPSKHFRLYRVARDLRPPTRPTAWTAPAGARLSTAPASTCSPSRSRGWVISRTYQPPPDRPPARAVRSPPHLTIGVPPCRTTAEAVETLERAGYTVSVHPRFGLTIEDGPTCGRCSQIIGPDDAGVATPRGSTVHEWCATGLERASASVADQVDADRAAAIRAAIMDGVAVEHETGRLGRFWFVPTTGIPTRPPAGTTRTATPASWTTCRTRWWSRKTRARPRGRETLVERLTATRGEGI
jgi:hypothetical protein